MRVGRFHVHPTGAVAAKGKTIGHVKAQGAKWRTFSVLGNISDHKSLRSAVEHLERDVSAR